MTKIYARYSSLCNACGQEGTNTTNEQRGIFTRHVYTCDHVGAAPAFQGTVWTATASTWYYNTTSASFERAQEHCENCGTPGRLTAQNDANPSMTDYRRCCDTCGHTWSYNVATYKIQTATPGPVATEKPGKTVRHAVDAILEYLRGHGGFATEKTMIRDLDGIELPNGKTLRTGKLNDAILVCIADHTVTREQGAMRGAVRGGDVLRVTG